MRAFISQHCGRMVFLVGLAGGLSAGWLLFPQLLYSRQAQPMDFNHALHTDDGGMACEECHAFRDDGSFSGIPTIDVCADCHSDPLGESAAEAVLIAAYIEPAQEVPWFVYARQPQNVYFSHAAHVRLADIACDRCHGFQGTSTTLQPGETNRISTYSRHIWGPRISGGGSQVWEAMKMSDCSACHAQRDVQDSCLMCHK